MEKYCPYGAISFTIPFFFHECTVLHNQICGKNIPQQRAGRYLVYRNCTPATAFEIASRGRGGGGGRRSR
jgi:hypothetical protein